MKQIYMIAALVLSLMTGCSSNKKDAQEETKRMFQIERVDENSELQRMQVSRPRRPEKGHYPLRPPMGTVYHTATTVCFAGI